MKDSLSSSSLFITLVFRLLTIRKHFFASSIHSPSATSNTNKQLEAIQHANSNSFSCDVGRGVGRAWPHYSISHSGSQPTIPLLHLPSPVGKCTPEICAVSSISPILHMGSRGKNMKTCSQVAQCGTICPSRHLTLREKDVLTAAAAA